MCSSPECTLRSISAASRRSKLEALFDDLVGPGEKHWGHGEAELLLLFGVVGARLKIHATGNGLVPIVDQSLYDQIISLVGGQPGTISASLPKSAAQLAPGHLVIAPASLEDGYWPAIVTKRSGETVTLKWRDYPGEPEIVRPITALALLNAD